MNTTAMAPGFAPTGCAPATSLSFGFAGAGHAGFDE
jgi:hypothetical protein